jgi:thiamine pyrophosphokinase
VAVFPFFVLYKNLLGEMLMIPHKRIAVICSAPIGNISRLQEKIATFPVLIAVDGGINHCYKLNLHPDLIVGDFDSADLKILKNFDNVPQKIYPQDKDKTDLEIALELAYHAEAEEITIFGALGGRVDHTLGNLILLSRYPGVTFLETDDERIFVINHQAEIATYPGQLISLIPLNGPVKGINTEGVKWQLENAILDNQFISISNEALDYRVMISVKEGDLLCCLNI